VSSPPETVIEFLDYKENPSSRGPHKTARVRINGHEVLVAKDGIHLSCGDGETTQVTLQLLPSEVHFVND